MTSRQSMLGCITAGAMLSLGFALSGSAIAQAPSCKADFAKFCPQAMAGTGQVSACLKKYAANLSAPCKERVGQAQKLLKEINKACAEDIHFLCEGIQPGGGRIAACLKQSADEVSAGCKAQLTAAKQKK